MSYAQQMTQREQALIKAVQNAMLPWAIGEKLNIQTWDTQSQIDRCCNCPFVECFDCISQQKAGGRGQKRDLSEFKKLLALGLSRKQICEQLNISKTTYFRMVKDFREEKI